MLLLLSYNPRDQAQFETHSALSMAKDRFNTCRARNTPPTRREKNKSPLVWWLTTHNNIHVTLLQSMKQFYILQNKFTSTKQIYN